MISIRHPAWGQHESQEPDEDPWQGRDFMELCRAVVCNGPQHGAGAGVGCILWPRGTSLLYEMRECSCSSPEDLGLGDAPHGISVWEGRFVANTDAHPDRDPLTQPRGQFRRPTDAEWEAIREGRAPWEREGSDDGREEEQ